VRVSTNVTSMTAQRSLGNANRVQETAMSRLSTGDRIYQAALDPSGLAISEKMRSHSKSMKQASRNGLEAVSLFQVAEGALDTIHAMAIRMKELAIQSASDTVGESERGFANQEYQALKSEVVRITTATNYNGKYLLNDSGNNFEFQVGIFNRGEERINYDLSKIIGKANAFGAGSSGISSKEAAQIAISTIGGMVNEVSSSRAQVGAITSRMQTAILNNQNSDENLNAAKSKIRDSDYAHEAAEKAKATIIQGTATTILAAANNVSAGALKLVG
jgi:flagellin